MPTREGKEKYERVKVMALSVCAPWPWAIFHAAPWKNIENRDWFSPYTGWLAIHQSKKAVTRDVFDSFLARYTSAGGDITKVPQREEYEPGVIVGVTRMVACVKQHASPWFEGKFGFVLDDPIALARPIPIKGALSLWGIPQPERGQLFDQIGDKMMAVERRLLDEKARTVQV